MSPREIVILSMFRAGVFRCPPGVCRATWRLVYRQARVNARHCHIAERQLVQFRGFRYVEKPQTQTP